MLPIVKRYGIKIIADNFIFQQDGAKPYMSRQSMEAIEKLGFSVIAPEKWPSNSLRLKPARLFLLE